ncbi:MAG: sigma 54-interacting transcriptional regulator [Planctomycetia bacterium]|nr:sigma 54-interacting transcriptional regulator [Planctomycetia bacterium]
MNASAYLVFRDESRWNEVFRLTSDRVTAIGRAPSNTIVLKDDRCSRAQAQIRFDEEQDAWFLKDLQSRNGTLVNGRKIDSEAEFRLSTNDILMFGKSHLMFLNELRELPSDGSSSEFQIPPAEFATEKMDSSSVLGSSHVLSGNMEVSEETMITFRRDKARLLETIELENSGPSNPAGKRIRRSIANLCRLAIEINRGADERAKLDLALQYLLRELPVNHAAVLLLPVPCEDKFPIDALEVSASMTSGAGIRGKSNTYQKVSDYLAQTVLESRNAVIARHVRGDSILGRRNSEGIIDTTSVICAPIFVDARRWGILHVYSTDPRRVPDVQDLDFTLGVAEILGIMFENLREQNLLEESLNRARDENADLRKRLGVQSEIIGNSPAVQEITEQIALAANSRATVLIHGESGSGKELVARAVHFSSSRKKAPFVCLNCAVLSEDLLASELFGHERGAFTGATDRKIGKFEAANGGTLMLDEIGEMGLNIQAKFLRVLEGHPFERVGGTKPISVDVRVIAATNRDLEQEVIAGRFRKDLFFRLRVVEILVPPLRQRVTDIPILAEHFFQRFRAETGRKLLGFSQEALALLQQYAWPGNIRELKNVIERAVVLARGNRIEASDILLSNLAAGTDSGELSSIPALAPSGEDFRPVSLQEAELEHIRKTLEFTEGNKSRAALLLGIERTTLDRKIRKIQSAENS